MMDLDYIDSLGIGVLLNSAKLIGKDSGDIVIAGVSSEIKKIFDSEKDVVDFLRHG